VGQLDSSEVILEFDALFYISNAETEHCVIPNPEQSDYHVELVGVGDGSYSLYVKLTVDGTTASEQTIFGEIVENALYFYNIGVSDEVAAVVPDPMSDLEHLKEFIGGLPDESFDKPKLESQRKNALFNKIDEVILKVEAGNCTDAINKLFHDIRAKMDGDSTAQDWIINPEMQSDLCVIIDHIISSIETLQPQPD